jgi:hypothetical protein
MIVLATIVPSYCCPTIAFGMLSVVITGTPWPVLIVNSRVPYPNSFDARTVNVNAPLADGDPVIAPVDSSSESPGGRLPATMLHITGASLSTVSISLYAVLIIPSGSIVVVIRTGPTTLSVSWRMLVPMSFVASSVNVYIPLTVGVPVKFMVHVPVVVSDLVLRPGAGGFGIGRHENINGLLIIIARIVSYGCPIVASGRLSTMTGNSPDLIVYVFV